MPEINKEKFLDFQKSFRKKTGADELTEDEESAMGKAARVLFGVGKEDYDKREKQKARKAMGYK